MTTVTFRDWTLLVDSEATLAAYSSVTNGSVEDCKCHDCINYSASKVNSFPQEIKVLFDQLGIDYRKESEVWRMYKHEDGMHLYSGIFHFKGAFTGRDCFVSTGGNGGEISVTAIDHNFGIGFRVASDLAVFENKHNLVQVEIEVKIPWLIDRKLEPEL